MSNNLLITVAIIFLIILLYLVITEYSSQDCLDRICLNSTPDIEYSDSPKEIIDKIIVKLRVINIPVEWRKSLLIGIVISFLTILFLKLELNLKNFIMIMFIIFFFVYISLTYTTWSYYLPVNSCLENNLMMLRSNI